MYVKSFDTFALCEHYFMYIIIKSDTDSWDFMNPGRYSSEDGSLFTNELKTVTPEIPQGSEATLWKSKPYFNSLMNHIDKCRYTHCVRRYYASALYYTFEYVVM